jgi:hypothetical protein
MILAKDWVVRKGFFTSGKMYTGGNLKVRSAIKKILYFRRFKKERKLML